MQVFEDDPGCQVVDGSLDLLEAADPPEVVPVGGQRAGPGGGRFLLHDQRRLEARPEPVHLILLDALWQLPKLPICPDLLARIDLIVDADSELHVSDFKSARSSWSDYKVDDVAPQLILYSELVKPIADGHPIKLSFAVLTKTKVRVLAVHDVPLDAQQVKRTKRTVERIWQAIQSGYFYPNPSPLSCGSCPCRAWTG